MIEPPDYSRDFLKVPRAVLRALIADELALRVYLLLLDRARYSRSGPEVTNGRRFDLELGQAVCGRDELAAKLAATPRRIRTALDLLEYLGFLTIQSTKLGTVVTLPGLTGNADQTDSKRPSGRPTGDQETTNGRPTGDQETTTNEDQRSEKGEGKTGEAAPTPPAKSVQSSSWKRRQSWWQAMLDADQRLRAAGYEPNAEGPAAQCAGINEKNMATCERQLREAGYSDEDVDRKMRHVVLVAEVECVRDTTRKWCKPWNIWDPVKFNRAVDMSLDDARNGVRGVPIGPKSRDPERPKTRNLLQVERPRSEPFKPS